MRSFPRERTDEMSSRLTEHCSGPALPSGGCAQEERRQAQPLTPSGGVWCSRRRAPGRPRWTQRPRSRR
eukprot:12803342-Alexandrium_andersonii.AAC.1